VAGEGDARLSAHLAVKYDSWSKACGQANRPLRPQIRPCGQSNLANNLFASSCDSRRPIIAFATRAPGQQVVEDRSDPADPKAENKTLDVEAARTCEVEEARRVPVVHLRWYRTMRM
jgi:hypothetical protein